MPSGVAKFELSRLSELSAAGAVELFRMLLWSAAHRWAVPLSTISITSRVDVADGGIDASISDKTDRPGEDLLLAGNSFFRLKAGRSAMPSRKSWLHSELFGKAELPHRASLGDAVRKCLGAKGRYVIVCFGVDPTPQDRRKGVEQLQALFKACGYKKPRVDIWGQSTIEGFISVYPSLALRLSNREHLPFLLHDEWKLDAEMSRQIHLGKVQNEFVETIRRHLRSARVRHIRAMTKSCG